MSLSRPERLFLDFDGVIMDSMALKLESYRQALLPYGFEIDAIRRVQRRTAGLSRQKTIPLMVRELGDASMSESEITAALERFRLSDEANRMHMQFMPGALEFLRAAKSAKLSTYVLTGTPQEVIETTIRHFELQSYFEGVLGSPTDKATHLREYTQALPGGAGACLFVGDSPKDQEASLQVRVPFAGLATQAEDMAAFDAENMIASLGSLADLLELIPL